MSTKIPTCTLQIQLSSIKISYKSFSYKKFNKTKWPEGRMVEIIAKKFQLKSLDPKKLKFVRFSSNLTKLCVFVPVT